ncbi:ABC transporter ATP-binding protein [Streptomyces sp. NPDC102467]|uniref:ABC transporter ATP-binding protein n=1 Tax=Streptomyces sp. NPDC102467 TaxID=3366179 RepID=UPI003824EB9A
MTAHTPEPLLEIPEISAYADGAPRPLLDQVALTVPAGAVVAVVGPSGSGKTTLGLAALGASRSGVELAGHVLLSGTDLMSLPPAQRRAARAGHTAHLPQHPESVLDPVRRTGNALTELAALAHAGRDARKAAASQALARCGLEWETVRRRFPHQLSGGQQQRLALASALVTGARLLVLDEPTSGLDPALAHALARTVRELADDGAGVLLLSHDLPMVRATADHVIVLERGRAVDAGPVADVLGAIAPDADAASPSGTAPAVARHRATEGLLAAERRIGVGRVTGPRAETPAARSSAGVCAEAIVVRRRSADLLAGPVSMAFPPGSRTSLIGPSGSGKTTFARVLAGLTTPTLGTVRHGGLLLPGRVDRRSAAQRRVVQYVHQSSADTFEAHRSILGQLSDTARLLRGLRETTATDEAIEAATALGLDEELLHRNPGRLSGGQLQRCALVRALTAHPALLVCDEVTSALDTVSRERVLEALPRLLAPARTALLFISHDLPAVRLLTEEVVMFEAGRCVRRGPLDEVLPPAWAGGAVAEGHERTALMTWGPQ